MECRPYNTHETQKQIDTVPAESLSDTPVGPKLTWRVISPYQMSGLHLAKGREKKLRRAREAKQAILAEGWQIGNKFFAVAPNPAVKRA